MLAVQLFGKFAENEAGSRGSIMNHIHLPAMFHVEHRAFALVIHPATGQPADTSRVPLLLWLR
jgi:hypothetical protein